MRRVVVTGLGALTPIGNNIAEYLQGLQNGRSGAAEITHFDAAKFKTRFACEVKNFDAKATLGVKSARRLDPFTQYAETAVKEAMNKSGLDTNTIDLDRAGVIWGSGIGGFTTIENETLAFAT